MHIGSFLSGEMGPARGQVAQPVPGDLHQALVGGLPQNRAVFPSESLSSSLTKVTLRGGS